MKNWSRWSILVYFTTPNSIPFQKKKIVINLPYYLNVSQLIHRFER